MNPEANHSHPSSEASVPMIQIHSAAPSQGGSGRKQLPFIAAWDFAKTTPEEVPWLVEPWIASGCITELDGKVKLAGKTTFVAGMVSAVLDGKDFLGYGTSKASVVWLTEQPRSSFREVLRRTGLLDRKDLHLLFWNDTMGVLWTEVVRQTGEFAQSVGAEIIVVDTVGQFARLIGDAENSAGEALRAMAPLQTLAGFGIAVMVVRHDRKSGGEVGESARGSSAFSGVADVIMHLGRPEGGHRSTIREIRAIGRFEDIPDRLMIELTEDGYVSLGTERAVESREALEKIGAALPDSKSEALRLEDLLERAPGVKRTVAQGALSLLIARGDAKSVGEGVRGDPRRFYRVSDDPRDSFCQNANAVGAAETESVIQSKMNSAAAHSHPAEGNGGQP